MTKEMERVIRNIPVVETRGRYVIGAHYGQGIPVVTVYCVDDDRKSIHLNLDLVRSVMTIVPSMLCRDTDTLWDTVVGLLHECGTCDERNRIVKFETGAALLEGLDRFLELLETV